MDTYSLVTSLLKSYNIEIGNISIETFYLNGESLPKLIAFSFGLKSIPGVVENPKSWPQKKLNNDVSIQYLIKNNAFFQKFKPEIDSKNGKIYFLKDILTKQIFSMKEPEILAKSNLILQSIGLQYQTYNDIINPLFLLSLLYVFADFDSQIISEIDKETDPIPFLKKILGKLNIIILDDIFGKESFPLQVQIIFKAFDDKNKDNQAKNNEKEVDFTAKINEIDFDFNNYNDLSEEDEFEFINYHEEEEEAEIQDEKMEEKDDDDDLNDNNNEQLMIGEDEKLEDEALLKTINYLTKQYFSDEFPTFIKFKQTLLNDFIPRFVMKFFNISTIENVELSPSDILTKQSIKNVYSVIKYLATKQKTFKVLIFDFYSPYERESSSKLFFKTFLNLFFITQPRDKMIERLDIFVGDENNDHFSLTTRMKRYEILIKIMQFIRKKPDDMPDELMMVFHEYLKLFSFPTVFHNLQWNTFANDDVMPDSFFYQIQFLFNEWDSNKLTYPIIEHLLRSKYKIKKMKVPRYDIISSSIKAKSTKIEETTENEDENANQESNDAKTKVEEDDDDDIEYINDDIQITPEIMKNKIFRFYRERQKVINNKTNDNIKDKNNNESKEKSKSELNQDAFDYWDRQSQSISFDNGIMRNNAIKCSIHFEKMEINNSNRRVFPVQPNLNQTNPNNENNNDINIIENSRELAIKMLNSHTNKETKLYKLFIYDETKNEWRFNSQDFYDFSKNLRLNTKGSKTPLVFLSNSNEQNVIDFNIHFIFGLYPKIEKEDDIFVYPICDKTLTMLSLKGDFNDQIKALTKPIFLQIHVPKSKENHPKLQKILFHISCYLYIISSLSIVILKNDISEDQLFYHQKILSLSKIVSQNKIQNNENEDEVKNIINKINNSIYLINIPQITYDERAAEKYHNHPAYSKYIDQSNSNEILLIDVKNVETYDHFFDYLSSILVDNNMNFTEVEQAFNSFTRSEISSKYIQIRMLTDWKSAMKEAIISRYLILISQNESKSSDNLANALSSVYNEITFFSPRFDSNFVKIYQSIILSIRKGISQKNRKEIDKELAISADLDILFIFDLLKNENFCTDELMNDMRRSHENFLSKEYHDIVKYTSNESLFDLVFEDNYDLISIQINKDRNKLNEKFNIINDELKIKNTIKESDAKESAKKNTNYVLKETENLREIKVAVQIKKDLTSIIEQDF